MIAFLDVQYCDDHSTARAAILLANQWTDGTASWMNVVDVAGVAPYQPGEFSRRERLFLQKALKSVSAGRHRKRLGLRQPEAAPVFGKELSAR